MTMSPEEFCKAMRAIAAESDKEARHAEADQLMCIVLRELGYAAGVAVFGDMEKWYA